MQIYIRISIHWFLYTKGRTTMETVWHTAPSFVQMMQTNILLWNYSFTVYPFLRLMSYCPREMMSFWAAAQEWDPSILPSSSFYCNWKIWWTRSTASMMSYCPVHPGLAAAVHEAADRRYVTLAQGTATLEPIQSSLLFHGGHLRRWLQVGSPAHLNRWCRFI